MLNEVAEKAIECVENFAYKDLELTDNLTELNIDDSHFEEMANRICRNGSISALVDIGKDVFM